MPMPENADGNAGKNGREMDIKKPVKRALLISFGSQDSGFCMCVFGPDSWHSC